MALSTRTPPDDVAARMAALGPDSTADLMFTSGTTGRPKGVMAAHGFAASTPPWACPSIAKPPPKSPSASPLNL